MHEVGMPEYDSRDEGVPVIEDIEQQMQEEHASLETIEDEPLQSHRADPTNNVQNEADD